MKNRIFAIILCLALALCLTACGGTPTQKSILSSSGGSSPAVTSGVSVPGSAEAPENTAEASSGSADISEPEQSGAATIQETVLLDQDGLVITAKELVYDDIWGPGLKLLIENNSDTGLGVSCESLAVNNYMIGQFFSTDVAAGKKANDTLYFSDDDLEAAGIETIADIWISFHVYDSSSYGTLFDTPELELRTSAYGTVEQPPMDDGVELYNQDGVRIVGRYVSEGTFWGAGVLLFIENSSGGNITVHCDDMSVNGFMVSPLFYCTVNSGRMALDEVTILSSDLEENGIEAVEDVELVFRIVDPESYHTLAETEPVSFSAK